MNNKEFIPMREAVNICNLHPHTIRSLCSKGIIEFFITQSGQRRIKTSSLLQYCKPKEVEEHKKNFLYARVSSAKPRTFGVV